MPPDHDDPTMTKRVWEKAVMDYRYALRAIAQHEKATWKDGCRIGVGLLKKSFKYMFEPNWNICLGSITIQMVEQHDVTQFIALFKYNYIEACRVWHLLQGWVAHLHDLNWTVVLNTQLGKMHDDKINIWRVIHIKDIGVQHAKHI